jgi:amidohydrolase
MIDFLAEALALFPYTQALRRDFHRHPELGFQEIRTAGIVTRELRTLGLEVTTQVAETGVVALVEGERPGPTIMLRFDMDALPIQEQNSCDYASQTAGKMHACGHDGHVAVGLTVARMLNGHRSELAGVVKFVFQPAEEGLGGAERMIAAGVLTNPVPQACLGMHLWNEKPVGWLAVVPGPMMAGGERFRIQISGKGGHAAAPQATIDPVVAAAQVIVALQTVTARNISPLQSAVISVASLHAGDAFNVIPDAAILSGTIRTFETEVRQLVLQRFTEIVLGVSQALGCQAEIEVKRLTPAVINDPAISALVQRTAVDLFPDFHLVTQYGTMISEDMAYFLEQVPGCFILVGSNNVARGLDAAHHHPRFDFDEQALPSAAALIASTTCKLLETGF